MQLKLLSAVLLAMLISGCGGGDTSSSTVTSYVTTPTSVTSVTADVQDTPDTTAPVINIIGLTPLNIAQNSIYIDAGAIALDDRDGIVRVSTIGNVNTEILGIYILTYTATDSANNTATTTRIVNVIDSSNFVTISGKITYDLVPVDSDNIGLDYDNIRQEAVKSAQVDAINSSNQSVASTSTDSSGHYSFALPNNTQIKVRVSAKMIQSGTPSWDVKVVDNTNNNALYVMEGALTSTGFSDSSRNLNASSGWDGRSYTLSRVAAPFAILDNAYKSIHKVLTANPNTLFSPLLMNWSINNVSLGGDTSLGQITTSHYTNSNLFILGDADSDTDEYDDHVVTHEWGHYYEDKLSRSDSIGGSHGSGDILDIRVAFSEGFGNAFSGMVLDEPVYFDTMGTGQASGFSFNMESETPDTPGWYSEASVQRILYDLYDDNSDGNDILNFGFIPLHAIFTGTQKTTPAFTSIFSFITLLKNENIGDADDIDTLVSSENIATITDIYGLGRVNQASDYPYNNLTVGTPLSISITNEYGDYNKLSNRKYVKFSITTSGTYTIKVQQVNGTNSDPDFYLFDTSPFSKVYSSEGTVSGLEQKDVTLSTGEYLLDVSEYNNIDNAQLNVSIMLK